MLLFDPELRLDGEDASGLERVGLQSAGIVDFESDVVAQPVRLLARAEALDELHRGGLDAVVGEAVRSHDRVHLLHGAGDHVDRTLVDLDRGHQRLIQTQVDLVHLALARRELSAGGKHARDVRLVVLVVGGVIELHQVVGFEHGRVAVVVRVVGVLSGRDEREVRRAERAELLEHELRVGLQLVFVHAGFCVAHRFHDAEAGDARRFADDGDLARTLHCAQRVEDRIEVPDLGLRRGRLQSGDERGFT